MAGRADVVARIAELVGDDVLRIDDAASGWPGFATLTVDGVSTPISLFAAPVGLSHRGRDDVERRFQNPGGARPITMDDPDRYPLLIGLWETDELLSVNRPLLVSADPIHRLDRNTRFSVFVSTNTLNAALRTGWAEDPNAIGETIRCFVPPLLSLSYAADRAGAAPAADAMRTAIDGSGLLTAPEPEIPAAAERARRAASALVRDARFARRVIDAYGGLCAMCGLDSELAQGAHIYPVSAPGSSDEPWNGLALCPNHHAAFDRHVVAVTPQTGEIVFHEEMLNRASENPALQAFLDGTFDRLAATATRSARPKKEMFEKRYEFYTDQYAWMPA